MRARFARPRTYVRLTCSLLSYLLLSMPLAATARMAGAASGSTRSTGTTVSNVPMKRTQAEAPSREGELIVRYREDVVEGLEHAPDALAGILGGRNFGKLLVRVGHDPL